MSATTASATPTGRRERKKAATRQRLLDAALRAFADRGYQATTVDDIAEAADVARATAFNYFPRKEDLVMGLVQQRREAAAAILSHDLSAGTETATALHEMLDSLAHWYEDDRDANRGFVRCAIQAGAALLPGWFDSAEIFATAIAAGQQRGDIRSDVDPQIAGALILDGYLGVLYRWASEEPGTALGPALTTMVDTLLGGLLARQARRGSRRGR
jgi:AcrR family transcriptional regulator